MRPPAFWQREGALLPAWLLAPLGWIYGRITLHRLKREGWRAPVPVISIGNFTVGGAGKTPTTLALAQAFLERGERPFILSRGYGGTETGPYRVQPDDPAHRVGDEPKLMSRHAPVIIARKRAEAAQLAIAQGASLLLLDDGLQNPDLVKDFSLAVIDGGFGFGNGFCMPAGPLRAPVGAMERHVDACLLIGPDASGVSDALTHRCHVGRLVPQPVVAEQLKGRKVFAFCGIARPEKFETTLKEIGATITDTRWFGDHQPFSEADASAILADAARIGAKPVTTQKDAMRLAGGPMRDALLRETVVLPVTMALPDNLLAAIYRAVDLASRRASTASGEA